MIRHARLILNPVSWSHKAWDKLPVLISTLDGAGIRVEVSFTKLTETLTQSVALATQERYDMVIAGGGDGTVGEVAAGLVGTDVPLGIIPLGTFNNIARSLKIPHDFEKALQVIADGHIKEIDVGRVNNLRFFEAAGIGLDASLFPIGEEIKGGHYEKLLTASLEILRYHNTEITISLDRNGTHRVVAPLVAVANGPYYGSGFTIAPQASLDDGLLTVVAFEGFTKPELLRHFWAIALGREAVSDRISVFEAREVAISSEVPLPCHADGKPIGRSPATFSITPHNLRVIAP